MAYLDEVAERLRSQGLAVETVVREGSSADIIVFRASALGAGLIAMATHGRTGLAGTFLGSVALEVIRRSLLPILLIRPAQAEALSLHFVTMLVGGHRAAQQ